LRSAGASGIRWSRFTLLDTAGAAAWTGAWVLAGAGIAAAAVARQPRPSHDAA
jgi:membrane protein DedA with SNARE-associated domain